MTFEKYWESRVLKTPQLADPETKMSIKVSALKKALQQTWNAALSGIKDKEDLAKKFEELGKGKGKGKGGFEELGDIFGLGGLFGGGKGKDKK